MNSFSSFFSKHSALGIQLLWEQTIYQVVWLFNEAEKRIRSAEGQQLYPNLDGWWRDSSHRINGKNGYRVPEETAISEALVEQMEFVKQEAMLNKNAVDQNIGDIESLEFHAEAPRRRKTGIGKRSKPTDFRFYRSGLSGFDLRIEAKVITKDSEVSKNYLSAAGLGRFSDAKEPYTDELVGGMIAYTVTDDRASWLAKIEKGFENMAPATPSFQHALQLGGQKMLFCQVPFNLPKTPAQSEVLVFHLALEIDCAPPAR